MDKTKINFSANFAVAGGISFSCTGDIRANLEQDMFDTNKITRFIEGSATCTRCFKAFNLNSLLQMKSEVEAFIRTTFPVEALEVSVVWENGTSNLTLSS